MFSLPCSGFQPEEIWKENVSRFYCLCICQQNYSENRKNSIKFGLYLWVCMGGGGKLAKEIQVQK